MTSTGRYSDQIAKALSVMMYHIVFKLVVSYAIVRTAQA